MRLEISGLKKHLEKTLLPVYLVTGDEPLQCSETADLIRIMAKRHGYRERVIMEHNRYFDWRLLEGNGNAISLFEERRLLDLRLDSNKIGNEGSAAISNWLKDPPPDVVLLITAPKLDKAQETQKWFEAISHQGATISIWPIEGEKLVPWLQKRLQERGLQADLEVAKWLAERVEGNLLAAAQEVEKLLLLHGRGQLVLEQLQDTVANSSRYSVFGLVDSLLEGNTTRALRVMRALRDEGTAEVLVLWVLAKEVRLLASLAIQARSGVPIPKVVADHREIRAHQRSGYIKALSRMPSGHWLKLLGRCVQADWVIKGLSRGADPWIHLEQLTLAIMGEVGEPPHR